MLLKAKAVASNKDNPNWWEATRIPLAHDYWRADCKEVENLQNMGAWEIVDHTIDMHVLYLSRSFKIKRFPSVLINKFKARFCAKCDQKLDGVDYFDIYAPLFQWATVRLMLIFKLVLDLKSKQSNITAAFMHANIPEGENIYVAMPRGFRQKGN